MSLIPKPPETRTKELKHGSFKIGKARSHFMKNFFFGFVTCAALIFGAALSFVLFCPLWQGWRHPKHPAPKVKVITTPPKIYFVPIPNKSNSGNEVPEKHAPKF